jgi:hypothetical protein
MAARPREFVDDREPGGPSSTPPHGHVSHGAGAFLHWVGRQRDEIDGFDPSLDELGELYDKWRQQHEQADLGRWSQ